MQIPTYCYPTWQEDSAGAVQKIWQKYTQASDELT